MLTDAQRRANNKWDRENMSNINCKMRREIAEEFKAAAKANGTTPNALIRAWIDEYIQNRKPTE
nr:MAG TPA: ParG [Caudoviricetes sp.]